MKFRTRSLLVSSCLALALLFQVISPAAANTLRLPDLEPFLDGLLQTYLEEQDLPNLTAAVVADGEVVYLRGLGFANLEENLPVEPENTLFRIGSTAKLVTWTAVMQLVEQGLIDLDADINEYLDFEIPASLHFSREGNLPAPITMRHLMTHTAGFEAYPDAIFRLSAESLLPLEDHVRVYQPKRIFPPGSVAAYSNYGTGLAGYIVQRVSGQPFAEYTEQHIFTPLGMSSTTFRQPVPPQAGIRQAQPYRFVNGDYLLGEIEYMQEPEGSLSSTAADMAIFMLAHLQDGSINASRILHADTLRQMHTPQPGRYPGQGGMTLGFMHGVYNNQAVLFHGGSTTVFDSGLYLLPEQNVGIFITYSGGSHLIHGEIFQAFLDRYYPAEASSPVAAPAGMPERSRQYAGEYHQNSKSFTTAEAFTSLMMGVVQVAVDEEGYLLITHVGETNRFLEVGPGVYLSLQEGRSQDYFGPFRTVVFSTDPLGNTMLSPDGPMTYSRAAWYGSSAFTLPALILILLLMLGSLVLWGLGAIAKRIRRRPASQPAVSRLARWTGAVNALLAVVFIVGLVLSGNPHPVHLLPMPAFGIYSPLDSLLDLIPWALVASGIAVAAFAILAWVKGFWRLPGRVHYTFFSAAALLLVWIFWYWNVL